MRKLIEKKKTENNELFLKTGSGKKYAETDQKN